MRRSVVVLAFAAAPASAQVVVGVHAEGVVARNAVALAGGEVAWRVSPTVRVTAAVGGGAGGADAGTWGRLVRGEVGARFTVDPYAERRWAGYGSAGLVVTAGERRRGRVAAAVAVGADGPARRGWRPALEVGFADGVRLRIGLRRGGADDR